MTRGRRSTEEEEEVYDEAAAMLREIPLQASRRGYGELLRREGVHSERASGDGALGARAEGVPDARGHPFCRSSRQATVNEEEAAAAPEIEASRRCSRVCSASC